MTTTENLQVLLQRDADDVLAEARGLDSRRRFRLMRVAAEYYGNIVNPAERLKLVWALQALLASTEDRRLPIDTALEVAVRLADITQSREENVEVRRGALDSLALVFLKTKTLTGPIDKLVRGAFTSASKSNDRYLSEFAAEALSGEGLLATRAPLRDRSVFSRGFLDGIGWFKSNPTSVPSVGYAVVSRKASPAKKQASKRSAATPDRTAKHL